MKKLLSAVALSAFLAGPALAGNVTPLSDAQMDGVTAGLLNNINVQNIRNNATQVDRSANALSVRNNVARGGSQINGGNVQSNN